MGMGPVFRNTASNLPQQVGYAPTQSNFNDYVRYARSAIGAGQSPNAAGFQQFLSQQTQAPGTAKNQQVAPPVAQGQPINPTGRSVMTSGPIKPFAARPQQYGAALSRMK